MSLTLEDRWVLEGLTEKNEMFRHYIEAGYDLDLVDDDNKVVETGYEIEEIEGELESLRAEINSGSCPRELREELQGAHKEKVSLLVELALRRKYLESKLEGMVGQYPINPPPRSKEFGEQWDDEDLDPEGYTSAFHWQCAHDLAAKREEDLEIFLKRSSEEQDRKLLKRIESLRKRRELTAWWYYRLSTMVCAKHTKREDYNIFARMDKNAKRRARRLKKFFWAATSDRLINFRKTCENKSDGNWGPKPPPPLDVMHMSFDDRWDYGLSPTEDQIITKIDRESEQEARSSSSV